MGSKSRFFSWIGVAFLSLAILLGLVRLKDLSFKGSPPVLEVSQETAAPDPVAPAEPAPAQPPGPVTGPKTFLNRFFAPIPAPPAPAGKKPPRIIRSESYQKLEALIKKYAERHGVDEDLVWAVIRHESGFNPGAVSPKGAMGLMQLMPGTAASLGVRDPFDVEQNIQGGIKYLEMCLARFDQDVSLALAAYNAGPESVARYQGCPPFAETRQYVAAVLQDYAVGPQRQGLRLGSRGPASLPETVEPPQPQGLHWNLPIPVAKVAKAQWHLRGPRWSKFAWPGKLEALAAKSATGSPRPGQPQ